MRSNRKGNKSQLCIEILTLFWPDWCWTSPRKCLTECLLQLTKPAILYADSSQIVKSWTFWWFISHLDLQHPTVQSIEQYQMHEESQPRQSLQSQFHCLLTDVTCPHPDLHTKTRHIQYSLTHRTRSISANPVKMSWSNDQSLYRTGRVVFQPNVSGFTASMRCGERITWRPWFCIVGRRSPSQWDQFPSKLKNMFRLDQHWDERMRTMPTVMKWKEMLQKEH